MRRKDAPGKGDYTDAFSPVSHASGLRILLAIATEKDMYTDHVDISQAFTQGDLQPGDDYMGKLYISAPPGFLRIRTIAIASSSLFMACPVRHALGSKP